MSYSTSVHPGLRLGLASVHGPTYGGDLAEANEALYHDPQWRPGFDELWCCSGITEFVVSLEELGEIVQMETAHAARVGTGRVALVITREVVRMIGELYQHLIAEAGREVGLFETLEDAAAWLGLSGVPAWFDEQASAAAAGAPSARLARHGW